MGYILLGLPFLVGGNSLLYLLQESDGVTESDGVIQGSILGPLCFLLSINDLPLAVDAHTVLFADDTAFVITASSLNELYSKIERLFTDIASYLHRNRLVPNSSNIYIYLYVFI